MTVNELKQKLLAMPPHHEVILWDSERRRFSSEIHVKEDPSQAEFQFWPDKELDLNSIQRDTQSSFKL